MTTNINRRFKKFNGSFFLLGPRGTGKSTWLKMAFPNALVIDLLVGETFRFYQANPERLAETVRGNPAVDVFVIDEIQKIPLLLETVHRLIANGEKRMFVLTGSSVRKLKREGADLLAGRAARLTMHPFVASELGDDFDLDRALQWFIEVFSGKPAIRSVTNSHPCGSRYRFAECA